MSYDNFPTKFGFEPDLRKCVGKTIESVELMEMEYGCTWSHAWAVRFTDGARAFFAGKPGTGIMNPRLDGNVYGGVHSVETSAIFTKPEYAEMVTARIETKRRRERERERVEREQLERLARKYGK